MENNLINYHKYIKYKKKYLQLLNNYEGGTPGTMMKISACARRKLDRKRRLRKRAKNLNPMEISTLEEKRKKFKSDSNPMKNPIYKQKVIDARKGTNNWVTDSMKEKTKKRIQKSVKNNSQYANKSIIQYDLNGNFIKEWISLKEIQKTLGFCSRVLIDVCKERKISACGFVWRYKTSNYLLKIEIPKVSIKRLLIQYDKKMNIINEFKSLMDAHKTTNVSRTAISNNLSSLSKSAGGFIWKYKQLNN